VILYFWQAVEITKEPVSVLEGGKVRQGTTNTKNYDGRIRGYVVLDFKFDA